MADKLTGVGVTGASGRGVGVEGAELAEVGTEPHSFFDPSFFFDFFSLTLAFSIFFCAGSTFLVVVVVVVFKSEALFSSSTSSLAAKSMFKKVPDAVFGLYTVGVESLESFVDSVAGSADSGASSNAFLA